jgi:hypothetical protein
MPAPLPSNDAPDTEPMRASGRALAAGERWAEFEIERVLCETATSIVYLATDHALEVQVAVKEYMPLQLAWRDAAGQVHPAVGRPTDAWEAGRRAFIGEARLLARTDHPALMRVLRLWEAQGTACCVMPYLPGKRLIDARESPEWLPPEAQVLQMLDALLGALANFHAVAGAAHGGVRPSNILVRPGGTPVLLGPGQASRATASDLVESLMARLEPSFAPPELSVSIGDHAPGPWSDLYALAAVMRWWMTGAAPPSAAQVAAGRRLEPMGELMRRLHGAWPQRPYAAAARPRPPAQRGRVPRAPGAAAAGALALARCGAGVGCLRLIHRASRASVGAGATGPGRASGFRGTHGAHRGAASDLQAHAFGPPGTPQRADAAG